MSCIEDMIAEFCPTGVPFEPIGAVTTKGSNIKWANASGEGFRYIDLTSVDRMTRKIGDTATITAADAPSRAQQVVRAGDVIFATTRPTQMRWAVIPQEYDGQIASTGYCVLRPDTSVVDTNFLGHILGADAFRQYIEANQVAGSYPSIPDSRVRAYRIPVPPPEIQGEIVRILGHFSELEAELEAELDARSRQRAFYRDRLLSFVESEVEWTAMPAVSMNLDSRRKPVTKAARDAGEYPYYGASGVVDFVRGYIFDGDYLLVSEDGANLLARSTPIAFSISGKAWVNNHAHILEFDSYADRRFVEIYLNSIDLGPFVTGGAQPKLNQANLNKIPLPWPAPHERERVVGVLDKFDALLNDPTDGLPAELSARRRQYAYYRDKLLAFVEAGA
jgi:type I restriction enzyme S subunit